MITTASILKYDGSTLLLAPDDDLQRELLQKSISRVELRLTDGREISADQRRKIFAIIKDIAVWSGHDPEYIRSFLTWDFVGQTDKEYFSLSDVDMTTAKEFINYLIEFCFAHTVPTKDTTLNYSDDLYKYLYLCLEHRKCAICNAKAQVHHVDRVGMGRDREDIVHVGMRAIALCYEHHNEAHQSEKELFEKYHIHGIPLDRYLCDRLNLNTEVRR